EASTPSPASPADTAGSVRATAAARRRGAEAPSGARRPEAADAALGGRQVVDLHELDLRQRHDDELGDPHPGLDDERLAAIRVQERDAQLAAVARVDEPRRVDDRDAVLARQAGARLDEAGVPLRNRHCEAGADERALSGRQLDPFACGEVEARVAGVGTPGNERVRAQPLDENLGQAVSRRAASATRYGAKRSSSRRGSRATTSTPSGVSSRSSTGEPRA